LAVLNLLPHLAGHNILLHEDSQAVCYVLAGLTSRSHEIIEELRHPWFMLDSNNIHIGLRYIGSASSTWADKLIRHLDSDDRQLDPIVFLEMDSHLGSHKIDRFASALNTLLLIYKAN
jgi:hypothetical protein